MALAYDNATINFNDDFVSDFKATSGSGGLWHMTKKEEQWKLINDSLRVRFQLAFAARYLLNIIKLLNIKSADNLEYIDTDFLAFRWKDDRAAAEQINPTQSR